jgi:phage/plasmid-like protein (TIGR03299 family)
MDNWGVEKIAFRHHFTGELLSDHFGIYRTDTGQLIGKAGARTEVMQNEFMFGFMDAMLDADGEAHYETAGALGNGERIFMSANLGTSHDILGSGDKHSAYFVGVGSHDGSLATQFYLSEVRHVCHNTVQLGLRTQLANGVKTKRTKNAEARLNDKISDLRGSRIAFGSLMEKLEFLAQRQADGKFIDEIIADYFDIKGSLDDASTRAKGSVEIVKQLIENNDNNAFPQFRGTVYNAFNGLTEFEDHYSEVRVTSGREGKDKELLRVESAQFGRGSNRKARILDIVIKKAETLASTNAMKSYSFGNSDSSILDAVLDNA